MPVGNERATVDAPTSSRANPSSQVVAAEAKRSGTGDGREVVRLRRLNQAMNGLDTDKPATDSNGRNDEKAGAALSHLRAEHEGNSERHSGQGITNVVDEISKERDAATCREHHRLRGRRYPQHSE